MSIFSDFFEWLLPDPPKIPEPKVNGAEFQIQRPEKCQFLYGEFTREQPHLVRSEMKQVGTGVPNNVMVMQVVWSQGPVQSIDKLYINDLDADGNDFNLPSGTTSNGLHFGGTVVKYKHVPDGGSKRFSVGGYTLEEFNGYGNAYSIIAVIYDSSLMPGKPKVTGSGKGKKIKNLSNSLVEYTNNAIDVYYDYCVNAHGARIPVSRFTDAELLLERAFADTDVTTADNTTQKMMTFNGKLDGNKNAVDNLNEMRKQMRIFMPLVDGKYKVLIERPRTPENFTIDESNRMSDWEISNVNSSDLLSKVIVKFKDKEQLGKEAKVEYPESGSDDNTITVTLNGVNNAYEAMQYAYIIYLRSSSSRKASGKVNKSALPYYVGQVIKMDEPRLGMTNKNWLITNKSVSDNIVDFDLIEYDETIYPWVAHPIPTYPVANVPNNRSVNPPTSLVKSEDNGDTIISWVSDYDDFDVQQIVGGTLTDLGSTAHKFINLGNLPQGNHEVMVRAVNGLDYPSEWVTFAFTVNTPATPTGLSVTDSYIEWSHPNLSDIREFIIETTENTANDVVAYSQPPSSNGTQRLEISGIKAGDYDVSVTAKGLNNLLSLPATLTNAQIDGITPIVTPIINDAIGGFANDPHTWTALNNFTGGLEKNGVDVLAKGDYGVGALSTVSFIDDFKKQFEGGFYYCIGTTTLNSPFPENQIATVLVISRAIETSFIVKQVATDSTFVGVYRSDNNTLLWQELADLNKNQTFTGDKNFTGQLLKNGSPVIGLEDLTYNSDESLAIAATTIEQFYKDQEAGLYDDFDQGVGSLAAGFVNSIINQANFLIANNANIDKLKSSAIEVSGSGYALNQNPTWQDTLAGWTFKSNTNATIIKNPSRRVTNQQINVTTTSNMGEFHSNKLPINPNDTYTVSVWATQPPGDSGQYLYVEFFDSNDNVIQGSGSGMTGWDGLGSRFYFGLFNQHGSPAWKKYQVKMGLNGDAGIPSNAVTCTIGALVNWTGSSSETLSLQDYRIEKASGRTHIENGAIQTKHLVLDGDGAITFDTVGADQAGAAAQAEANAKAYAFPNSDAGSLAYLNEIGSTEITSGAVTSPKIQSGAVLTDKLAASAVTADKVSASQALIDKLVANYIFGQNATFEGEVYARNLTGDANEYGESSVSGKSIPTSYVNLFDCNIGVDQYLDREVTIESFDITDGSGCTVQMLRQGGSLSGFNTGSPDDIKTVSTYISGGNNRVSTKETSFIIPANSSLTWIGIRAKNNVGSQSPNFGTQVVRYRVRPIRGSLVVNDL